MIKTKLNMKGLANLSKRLANLSKLQARVGVFDGTYEDGTTVAQVAQWNEYGTRFHPERPFMRETLEDSATRRKIVQFMKLIVKSVIKGDSASRRIMQNMASMVAEDIKVTIANYPGNNSKATVERKGFDRPLFESGKMLESVTFKLSSAGGFV